MKEGRIHDSFSRVPRTGGHWAGAVTEIKSPFGVFSHCVTVGPTDRMTYRVACMRFILELTSQKDTSQNRTDQHDTDRRYAGHHITGQQYTGHHIMDYEPPKTLLVKPA